MGTTLSQAAQDLQTGALTVAEDSGKAFWGLFGALLLGMVAAILGATLGVSRRQRLWTEAVPPAHSTAPEGFGGTRAHDLTVGRVAFVARR